MAPAGVQQQPVAGPGPFTSALKGPRAPGWGFLIILANIWQDFAASEAMQGGLGSSSPLSGTQVHLESFTPSVSSPTTKPQVGIYACAGDALGPHPGACVWDKHRPHLRQLDIIPGMLFPTDREILYYLKSINDAQQIPGVPGRNYLMQLRR